MKISILQNIGNPGNIHVVRRPRKAFRVFIPEASGFPLVAMRERAGQWNVTEPRTGTRLAVFAHTPAQAVRMARSRLRQTMIDDRLDRKGLKRRFYKGRGMALKEQQRRRKHQLSQP